MGGCFQISVTFFVAREVEIRAVKQKLKTSTQNDNSDGYRGTSKDTRGRVTSLAPLP